MKNEVIGKVKKTGKVYRFAKKVLVLGLGGVATFLTHQGFVAIDIANSGYKSKSQIKQDAESFNADLKIAEYGPIPMTLTRLKHNNGKPIYYYIGSGFSDTEKEILTLSAEYFNAMFEVINPNYVLKEAKQHEVIMHGIAGKTVFSYQRSYGAKFSGASLNRYNPLSWDFIGGATILIDDEQGKIHESNDEVLMSMGKGTFMRLVLEEMMHMFGLRDVYINSENKNGIFIGLNNNTNIVHTNTLMQNYIFMRPDTTDLTPSDFAVLNALYNQSHLKNGKVDQQKLELVQNMMHDYNTSYFKSRIPLVDKYLKDRSVNNNYSQIRKINPNRLNNTNIVFEEIYDHSASSYKSLGSYNHKVMFNNNKITYTILDRTTNEVIDEVTSDYYLVDGVVFVQNAFFKKGIVPDITSRYTPGGGTVTDYALVLTESGYKTVNLMHINRANLFTEDQQEEFISTLKQMANNLNKNLQKVNVNTNGPISFNNINKMQSNQNSNYSFILPDESFGDKHM